MTASDESSIEAIRAELDTLNSQFLDCLTNQDFSSMEAINEKISALESQLLELDKSGSVVEELPEEALSPEKASLSAAQLLIAELESYSEDDSPGVESFAASSESPEEESSVLPVSAGISQAEEQHSDVPPSEIPSLAVDATVSAEGKELQDSLTASQSDVLTPLSTGTVPPDVKSLAVKLGIRSQSVSSSKIARESMFKAAQRVQQRQSEEAIEIRQSDEKLAEALLVKQVVEHTTSFLDLFFNPNKFISKQLEKQNKAVEPTAKLPSDASKGTDALAQNDFEASSANGQESSAAKELRQKLESFCFYELLSVSQTASSDEIGRAYLDKLKNLRARFQAKKDLQEWQLNELVRALNRASEVLGDSVTRKKYDLSLLGIHEFEKYPVEKSSATAGKKQEDTGGSVVALGLSQLFVIGGLISAPELEKAAAGGHTINDRRLIEFIVDTELATFDEISAVILAQALIAKGRLTMSQFKLGMKEMRTNSIRFVDTLVAEGWLSAEDLPSAR